MKNLRIYASLVDGGELPLHDDVPSGREVIEGLITDDWGPPPLFLAFESEAEDGRRVIVRIPYDHDSPAYVVIREAGEPRRRDLS
jgi:hypothetical protein